MKYTYDNIYIISKRKLCIREVSVAYSTAVYVKNIGDTVFFDKASAEDRLEQLILERSTKK